MDSTIRGALTRLEIAMNGLELWLKREDVPENVKEQLRLQAMAGQAMIDIAKEYIKSTGK